VKKELTSLNKCQASNLEQREKGETHGSFLEGRVNVFFEKEKDVGYAKLRRRGFLARRGDLLRSYLEKD